MAVQIIDDRHQSLIYSEGWEISTSPNAYNSTVSSATTAGAKVRINFQTIGQDGALSIYGTIGPRTPGLVPPHSAYSLDGRAFVYFNASESGDAQYNQLFYQSPLLGIGVHSLTVNNLLPASALHLDYFLVAPPSYKVPLISSSTPVASTRSPTIVVSGISSSSTNTTTTSITQQALIASTVTVTGATHSSSSITTTQAVPSATLAPGTATKDVSKIPTTVIVGFTLGVVVIIVVLLGVVFMWLRWRTRRRAMSDAQIISRFVDERTSRSAVPISEGRPLRSSLHSSYSSHNASETSSQVANSSQGSCQPVGPNPVTSHTPYNLQLEASHGHSGAHAVVTDYDPTSPPDYACITDPPSYARPPSLRFHSSERLLPSKLRAEFAAR